MAEQFYTILTHIGTAKMANASALGQKVEFTNFALGDGGGSYYNPFESQKELINEVWRGLIGNVAIDEDNPNWIVIETIIPASIGGFMIREAGVFDDEGNLIAIGKYPETYKPIVENGSAKDLYIRMILEVSNTAVVNLKIDPTVILATKKDIDILSNRIKKNEDDIKELKKGSTLIEDLGTENKTISGAINELDDKIKDLAGEGRTTETVKSAYDKAKEAFQSASDGKTVIASSITAKGVPASKEDTFPALAGKIDRIETDKTGDATAVAGDIAKGKTAYGKGNKLTGTLELTGNALLTHVLAGNTFYNDDLKVKRTGTMVNRGSPAQVLTSQGGQYNIPAGYFSGGSVKAQFANLFAGNIKSGVNVGGVVGSLEERAFLEESIVSVPSKTRDILAEDTHLTGLLPVTIPPGVEYLFCNNTSIFHIKYSSDPNFSLELMGTAGNTVRRLSIPYSGTSAIDAKHLSIVRLNGYSYMVTLVVRISTGSNQPTRTYSTIVELDSPLNCISFYCLLSKGPSGVIRWNASDFVCYS